MRLGVPARCGRAQQLGDDAGVTLSTNSDRGASESRSVCARFCDREECPILIPICSHRKEH